MSERGTKLSQGAPHLQVRLTGLALKEGPSCEHWVRTSDVIRPIMEECNCF